VRNPVSKYDYNRGGWHKDEKNDFDRQTLKRELEKELEEGEISLEGEDVGDDEPEIKSGFIDRCLEISLKEYERAREHSFITSFN